MRKTLFAMLLCLAGTLCRAENRLKISPAPKGVELNDVYEVKARVPGGMWQRVDTYAFRVARNDDTGHRAVKTSVAKFDFEGTVEVAVTNMKTTVETFRVRPASYGIEARKQGNTITFTLDRPRYLSVECNGNLFDNLQLFTDSIVEKPKVKKSDLIYFGPGLHVLPDDSLAIPSGKTVYIDGSAYIKGRLSVYKAGNVRIIGHGIVMPESYSGIAVRYSNNVTIDGPITTQMPVGGSDSVCVRNAKVLSWFGWGDGMNVFASNNVSYANVFCRTSDDCSTIYCTRKGYHGGCRNISVRRAVYWADVAHPIMIGLHGDIDKNEVIENVVYDDIDILDQCEQQTDYQGCIAINNGDNILVRDITFSNIRIENLRRGMLFNLRVCYNKKYCNAPGRGIENITFKNVSYTGEKPNMSIITGYDESRTIRNITFDNLLINGVRISDDMSGKPKWYKTTDMCNMFMGEHVSGVTFR